MRQKAIYKSGINRDDFVEIMTKKFVASSEVSDADLEKCFKMIDEDKSGAITGEEFAAVLKKIPNCDF